MEQSTNSYFVKQGYIPNLRARTFESHEKGSYWTAERINSVANFQYDVYQYAAKLSVRNNLHRGLDLGCGPATKTSSILAPVLKEIFLVDQPNCEGIAKENLPDAAFYGVNLEELSLKLKLTLDLIICADVLEHLSNPLPSLLFAVEHLSPSGFAIFSTPERDILRGQKCMRSPHQAHVREWNKNEFIQLLEFVGFKVIEHHLLPPKKLTTSERLISPIASRMKLKKWSACQMAVCKR